jgi:large subunit ribosomal protein L25
MLSIKAEARSIFGKNLVAARTSGKMPAVLYGAKDSTTPLFLSLSEFKKLLHKAGESTVVTVDTGAAKKDVLIHEVDYHPVTGEPLHADFYVIDKTKTIEIKVPLQYEGTSAAIKDLGGILVKVLHELEIEVLPMDIPHGIKVDISALSTLESQILVRDLTIPKGVKVLNGAEDVVAAISVAKEEVEAAPVDLSSIEVEKKGKKEEEGEAEAAAGSDKAES